MRSALLILPFLYLRPLVAQDVPAARDSALARELVARGIADQAIRDTLVQQMQAGRPADVSLITRMNVVDSTNLVWLKGVVAQRGWPGRTMVGPEASGFGFLIAQHAVQDTAFQAIVLGLMEEGITRNDVDGQHLALLADRVAVGRGQLQQYGTQARLENRRITFSPIFDSVNVDARRARLGLMPLAEYARHLDSIYGGQGRP